MVHVPAAVPDSHRDLLEAAHFGHLATIRSDGSPQSNAMWFGWDGSRLRFTHRTDRQKYRNLLVDGRVSFSVQDPALPYRFLEVRGVVESMEPDPGAVFFVELQDRYGVSFPAYDEDALRRVVIVVRPTKFVPVDGGMTPQERQHLHELLASLPTET